MITEKKLSHAQRRVLADVIKYGDAGAFGYAPIYPGFKRTAESLIRLELATATGGEWDLRGIVLTPAGREIALRVHAAREQARAEAREWKQMRDAAAAGT